MVETVNDERWAHIRGVTVTTVASLAGILAGVVSGEIASGPDDALGVAILAIATFIQFPILRVGGIEVENFGVKDYLFIAFMTFCFWFVSWSIVMTTGVEIGL